MSGQKAEVIARTQECVQAGKERIENNLSQLTRPTTGTARLEQLRESIQRGGKILTLACKVVSIFLKISIVFGIVLVGALFIDSRVLNFVLRLYEDNTFFRLLRDMAALDRMEPIYQGAIACGVALISNAVLLLFVRNISRLAASLASDGKPFSVAGAKKMRRTALTMLLLMIYNVPLGIIACALVLLFSHLMEYGGYIQEQADETSRIQEEMIISFAEITENKSGQTGQHIRRVSEYARILAAQLGLPPEQVDHIRIASTMHDVGKLMIPSEILEKPGKLTNEEYEIIKTHTTYGGELLRNVEGEEMALSRTIALQHHERVDGKGYPAHLSGEDISLEGRIVAVADVYDALTSRRSYKDAWDDQDAYNEILKGRGTQFDAQVVDAFSAAYDQIRQIRQQFADPQHA